MIAPIVCRHEKRHIKYVLVQWKKWIPNGCKRHIPEIDPTVIGRAFERAGTLTQIAVSTSHRPLRVNRKRTDMNASSNIEWLMQITRSHYKKKKTPHTQLGAVQTYLTELIKKLIKELIYHLQLYMTNGWTLKVQNKLITGFIQSSELLM